jgi:hypothetical protein
MYPAFSGNIFMLSCNRMVPHVQINGGLHAESNECHLLPTGVIIITPSIAMTTCPYIVMPHPCIPIYGCVAVVMEGYYYDNSCVILLGVLYNTPV